MGRDADGLVEDEKASPRDTQDDDIEWRAGIQVLLYRIESKLDRLALAAADACEASRTSDDGYEAEASMSDNRIAAEAERNPNTTDDGLVQVGFARKVHANGHVAFSAEGNALDRTYEWEPVFVRRPVSSEDVHREAAE